MTTLDESYELCRALNKRHGTTYYWSTYALPRIKRHHVHALYGFCRYADDIVDDLGDVPTEVREKELTSFGDRFFADLAEGRSDDPVLKAVVHTTRVRTASARGTIAGKSTIDPGTSLVSIR